MIKETLSLCPVCLKRIPAIVYEENNKIFIKKSCPEHGEFKDLYWSDARLYKKYNKYEFVNKIDFHQTEIDKGCPYDCGLCPAHKSSTILANIDVTNRCNLNCPICFANANKTGKIYEPSFEEIKNMMINLRNEIPPTPAIQFAGGEPTVRQDLPELIKLARDIGFVHIQLATNGIKLKNINYLKKIKEAGLSTIYLQFDGISEKPYLIARGKNLFPIKDKVIKNCRELEFNSVVLVPTLVKDVNDCEVGGIIDYAVKNVDVVRGVNFQPVSFSGRVDEDVLLNGRITIPDFIRLVEEQTSLTEEDFYPVPSVAPISIFVEKLFNKKKPTLSAHQHCGVATYVFVDDGKMIPITRFIDVEGFLELIKEYIEELDYNNKLKDIKVVLEIGSKLPSLIDLKNAPKYINIKKIISLIVNILKGDYDALAKFHYNTLMISCMHFMDAYNFDVDRVKRCCIHYAIPDGRIIPFCSYNTIHRKEVEEKFSKPKK
ncbi:tetraether lipid synthase Tes [Methanocaldococcus villosus]|uniref:tetraether lipid synthase Tes n=1 Tax=Methanocaldococcus villosus TaxID=667126 RepID=UPI001F3902E8|nr:radical SAM protein [Methanocaldococcus villosus]